MELHSNGVEVVVTPTTTSTGKATLGTPKWLKQSSKRVLHAVGNGLRTASSISHALGVEKGKVQSNLWHLKERGLLHSVKKDGSNELKYYLTTDKPTLEKLDLTPKKRKYTKRAVKKTVFTRTDLIKAEVINKLDDDKLAELGKTIAQLQADNVRYIDRISQLELILTEKEKEVWTLECEVFDKKAIIAYLESKQVKG